MAKTESEETPNSLSVRPHSRQAVPTPAPSRCVPFFEGSSYFRRLWGASRAKGRPQAMV